MNPTPTAATAAKIPPLPDGALAEPVAPERATQRPAQITSQERVGFGLSVVVVAIAVLADAAQAAEPRGLDGLGAEAAQQWRVRHQQALDDFRSWKFGLFVCFGPVTGDRADQLRFFKQRLPGREEYHYYTDAFLSEYPFAPVKTDTEAWAELIAASGARYSIFTAQWHDNFCNWDTKTTHGGQPIRDITDTPYGRDLLADYLASLNRKKIPTLLYYSTAVYKGKSPTNIYYRTEELNAQLDELIKYPHAGLWFDNISDVPSGANINAARLAFPQWIVGRRRGMDFASTEVGPGPLRREPWERCNTYFNGWYDQHLGREPGSIPHAPAIHLLVRTAGNGGNLALAISPNREGVFDPGFAECMRAIGVWLKANGQSIFGTEGGPYHFSQKPYRLPWGAATCSGNRVYLHLLTPLPLPEKKVDHLGDVWQSGWDGQLLTLPALPSRKLLKSYVLGNPAEKIDAAMDDKTLRVAVPEKSRDPLDTIVVLELDGDAVAIQPIDLAP